MSTRAHHYGVNAAADETGNGAVRNADDEAYKARNNGDQHGHANAVHRAHKEVTAEPVGTEPVHAGRGRAPENADRESIVR